METRIRARSLWVAVPRVETLGNNLVLKPTSNPRATLRTLPLTPTLPLYCAGIQPTWLFATNSRRVNELTQDRAEAFRQLNPDGTVSDEVF
jgi:hypothetical protein